MSRQHRDSKSGGVDFAARSRRTTSSVKILKRHTQQPTPMSPQDYRDNGGLPRRLSHHAAELCGSTIWVSQADRVARGPPLSNRGGSAPRRKPAVRGRRRAQARATVRPLLLTRSAKPRCEKRGASSVSRYSGVSSSQISELVTTLGVCFKRPPCIEIYASCNDEHADKPANLPQHALSARLPCAREYRHRQIANFRVCAILVALGGVGDM